MAVSSSSMKVASVTVMAISHGLTSLVRSVLVERTAVAAAICASCSTQMAKETERSQIIKRSIGALTAPKGNDNASWLETALAVTQDCSDTVRSNQGIDGLFAVFAPRLPVAALILAAHRSQAKMNSTTTTSAGWLRHTSHTFGTGAEFDVLDLCLARGMRRLVRRVVFYTSIR